MGLLHWPLTNLYWLSVIDSSIFAIFFQLWPRWLGRRAKVLDFWRTSNVDRINEWLSRFYSSKAIGSSDVPTYSETNRLRSIIKRRIISTEVAKTFQKMPIHLYLDYFNEDNDDATVTVPLQSLVTLCVLKQTNVAASLKRTKGSFIVLL